MLGNVHNADTADAAPPAAGPLGPFYYRRAQARAALGRAEEAIADALAGRKRDAVYLVSKVYPHNASRLSTIGNFPDCRGDGIEKVVRSRFSVV